MRKKGYLCWHLSGSNWMYLYYGLFDFNIKNYNQAG